MPVNQIGPKRSLGKFIAEYVAESVASDEALTRPGWTPSETDLSGESFRWLLDELDGIESHLSPRALRLARALRKRLVDRLPADPDSGYDLARGVDVVVRVSGNVAHIYFNVARERMDVSEMALLYPNLLDALNDHPGIGLLLGLEDGRPVTITPRGTAASGGGDPAARTGRAGAERGGPCPAAQFPALRRPRRHWRVEREGPGDHVREPGCHARRHWRAAGLPVPSGAPDCPRSTSPT